MKLLNIISGHIKDGNTIKTKLKKLSQKLRLSFFYIIQMTDLGLTNQFLKKTSKVCFGLSVRHINLLIPDGILHQG